MKNRKDEKKDKFNVILLHLNGTLNMTSAGLHSFIENKGYSIYSVFFRELDFLGTSPPPSRQELDALINLLKKLNPSIIGMSVQSMSFWDCVDLTLELKKHFSCPIMWGGIQPMIDPERCLEYADIIIKGEAEEALLELFEKIKSNKSYNKIKNLWVKDKKGKIHKNDYRDLIQNLDILPFPDYSDKNKFYIIKGVVYNKNPIPHYKYGYNITTSRGCPMRCTFCFEHVLNREFNFKYLRRRSVDNVIAELKQALKLYPKIEAINFWDNILTMDSNWIKEFSTKYKKEINKPFFCYGHASLIKNPEMIKDLANAGMRHIFLGMQSGSEKLRKETYKRSESNEDLFRAAKIIKKYSPNTELRFDTIMSEFETSESLKEGINFLLTIPKPFGINKNKMAYYFDFDITETAMNQGIITKDDIASANRKLKTQVATKTDVEKNPYINYYYLVGRKIVPNWFIKFCLNNKIETKYPRTFSKFYIIFDNVETKGQQFKRIIYLIRNGEFKYIFNKVFGKRVKLSN